MKRTLLWSILSLSLAVPSFAATTYYVDSTCGSSGTGTSTTCGASGPFKTIPEGVAALANPDDILNVRAGRYFAIPGTQGVIRVEGKNGSSGHYIIIQPYGYTGVGTGEAVYLDGTAAVSWTQCTDCSAGSAQTACRNFTGTCTDVYHATGASAGQKADGTPTRSMATAAAATAQYDSFFNGSEVAVRWAFTPTASERVLVDGSMGMYINTSSYIFIRGFHVRCVEDAGGYTDDNASHIIIQGNTFRYMMGNPSGGDYGFYLKHGDPIILDRNEFGYSGSEGIHSEPHLADVATGFLVEDNWIHGFSDSTVMGTYYASAGTPNGMTIATSGPTETGAGNYDTSIVRGNLIEFGSGGGSTALGINFEHHVDNLVIYDNIIHDIPGACAYWQLDGGVSGNGNKFFNNIMYNCCQTACQGGLNAHLDTGLSFSNNAIYNNTIYMTASVPAVAMFCNGGTCTNNLYRNNILYNPNSVQMVDVPNQGTHTGTLFDHNLVYSTYPGTLVSFEGTNVGCSNIGTLDPTNKCADPKFSNAAVYNFHLTTKSPAINAGTSSSMPTLKTKSIYNILASQHGLPKYSDGYSMIHGAWDMGACEYRKFWIFGENLGVVEPSPFMEAFCMVP